MAVAGKWRLAVLAFVFLPWAHPVRSEPATAGSGHPDRLTEMFTWWNQAMKTPGAFTEEAFARYFTADAPLVINGVETMRGPAGWADRFQMIQGATDAVEIVIPFRYSFQQGDRIYTYHIIRSRAAGKVDCMLAAGHAELEGDRISRVILVREPIDPASDPDCWKQ